MSKRSNHFSRQRRRFMQESLAGLGGIYLSSCTGKSLIAADPAAKSGKYLVNIQVHGGYDMNWFMSTVHAENVNFEGNLVQQKDPNTGAILLEFHKHFTARHTSDGYLMHPSYSSSPIDGRPLGLGMANVFGPQGDPAGDATTGLDLLRDKMTILTGLHYDVGHGIANRLLLHGSLTSYALTYSSLIAGHLARTNPRPLHYVQMTTSPGSFNSNWALTKGYEVPINVPTDDAFRKLTTSPANDFQLDDPVEKAVLAELNRTVAAVGNGAIPVFELSSSRSVFQTFISAFHDAVKVSTTDLLEKPIFNQIWKEYEDYATERVLDLIRPGSFFDEHNLSKPDPMGNLTEGGNPWYDLLAGTGGSINGSNVPSLGQAIKDKIRNSAFNFAAADYLIRDDQSAVIDINAPGGDYHDGGDGDLISQTITFSLIRKMLGNFSKYAPKNEPGSKLIDATTVVLFSEFDRSHNIIQNSNLVRRGTNHGNGTSVLIAGGGCAGGVVVGAMATDTGPYSTMKLKRAGNYSRSCPVNPFNGNPSTKEGVELDIKSLFPTMLTMFNVEIPANQITDQPAIPAAINPSYVSKRRWTALTKEVTAWVPNQKKKS